MYNFYCIVYIIINIFLYFINIILILYDIYIYVININLDFALVLFRIYNTLFSTEAIV